MFWGKKETNQVNWQNLENEEQLHEILNESSKQSVLIYKHSTRCGISSMALDRLERGWSESLDDLKPYFLDLIAFRNISDLVAKTFQVPHESPQIILIKDGKAVYNDSHMGISAHGIEEAIKKG